MIRIGIFGSENSHALAFSRIFNSPDSPYADMRVVAVGGEEREASEKIARECGVERIVAKPEDMLGDIDAVMITSRDGALHMKYALPFVSKGMPAFIDKPFTRSIAEAEELIRVCRENGARVVGGSSVKLVNDVVRLADFARDTANNGNVIGGDVWAPVNMHNAYGDFWFYASHLSETCIRIFGMPDAIETFRSGDQLTCVARYAAYDVTLHFTNGAYNYGATVLTEKNAMTSPIDISDCYDHEVAEFVDLVHTGRMPETFEQLAAPVTFMDRIARAL